MIQVSVKTYALVTFLLIVAIGCLAFYVYLDSTGIHLVVENKGKTPLVSCSVKVNDQTLNLRKLEPGAKQEIRFDDVDSSGVSLEYSFLSGVSGGFTTGSYDGTWTRERICLGDGAPECIPQPPSFFETLIFRRKYTPPIKWPGDSFASGPSR